jgi:hypothetical protein
MSFYYYYDIALYLYLHVTLMVVLMLHTGDLLTFECKPQIINALPKELNDIPNNTKFKIALKHFLHLHSFYSLYDFYNSDILTVVFVCDVFLLCVYILLNL